MYVIKAPVVIPHCFKMSKNVENQIWHQRYGHLSYKGIGVLVSKNMVLGLPKVKEPAEKCTDCMKGKQQKENITKKSTWRAETVLELIHSDICGPINPESNGGKRYFITFIDDYTRKTWIYLLSEKSEALVMFQRFKVLVENESKNKIKCLRTDRGGEYTSTAFNEFCDVNGIRRQLTAAYTPHQNGVSERKNRTIMNMVRCMLGDRNVPKKYWPEAVKMSVHILNRCPTFAVKDMTPEEAWSGRKPSVSHFRVFGCIAYAHIPDNLRKKLDDKSTVCVHLGISEESKAYKLYDPIKRKIIVSKDVKFDESKQWNWKNNTIEDNSSSKRIIDCVDSDTCSTSKDSNENNEEEIDNHEITNDTPVEEVFDSEESNDEEELGKRVTRRPAYLDDFVTNENYKISQELQNLAVFSPSEDPTTYDEAAKHDVWRKAMDAEIAAIENNNTWELTELPVNAKKIGVKWIYKTKYNEQGKIEKHKARLVAKGYSQQYGIDYNEVFAPVARWDTIRSILAIAAVNNWHVFQLDVKSAFLHGELNEEVYVEQPLGYQSERKELVYRLKKSLYGLRQAPRAWYSKIETYFGSEGFVKCPHEHTLFVKHDDGGRTIIVSLYVDDLIFTGNDQNMFDEFKKSMEKNFAMTDLGKMRYFLGIEVKQGDSGIFIHQQKYAVEILKRFGMNECNSVCNPIVPGCRLKRDGEGKASDATAYKQMVGCLMYLLATRPDMAFSVCLVARYMERPTEIHVAAVKRILRYLKGTTSYGLWYEKGKGSELTGWSDSDYAGDVDDRRSTSGYVFMIGTKVVSWSSKKQPIVTLSTTEAEFIAAASCACQGIWLSRILALIDKKRKKDCITILCDNSSSIKLSKNPVMHGRSKHIDVRFHFLRDLTKDGSVQLVHCSTNDQVADIMTKALSLESFSGNRDKLGLCKLEEINCV
jgi:transposase InsO family protein